MHHFTNVPTVSSNDGSPAPGAATKLVTTLGSLGYGSGRHGGRTWHLGSAGNEKSLNELRGLDPWGLNPLVL